MLMEKIRSVFCAAQKGPACVGRSSRASSGPAAWPLPSRRVAGRRAARFPLFYFFSWRSVSSNMIVSSTEYTRQNRARLFSKVSSEFVFVPLSPSFFMKEQIQTYCADVLGAGNHPGKQKNQDPQGQKTAVGSKRSQQALQVLGMLPPLRHRHP